jgi:PPM family protein phosphatase
MAETSTLKSPKVQASGSSSPEAAHRFATACAFAMLSHRGRVRHANQDACAGRPELGAFVVCDGMGGAAAGEVASHLAAEAFLHALSEPMQGRTRRTSLNDAVRAANQAVFRHSRKSPGLRGMGTTLVGALYEEANATLWLVHVGDSRCYRLRGSMLQLLTEDHSLVEEQVRAGTLSRIEAAVSPIRNIITRAVGSEAAVEPEIAAHMAQPGDVYLLATDGLTRELDDGRIGRILTEFFPRPNNAGAKDCVRHGALEAACGALVETANARGGRDNITVLLIGCL